jgi:predicted extracellular nuclease
LLCALLATACDGTPPSTGDCDAQTAPIGDIQGDGYRSPRANQPATVRGIVTGVESIRGFYIESAGSGRKAVSRAIFIDDDRHLSKARPGREVQLSGLVAEAGSGRDTMTTLTAIRSFSVCAEGLELPLTDVQLPLGNRAREALEGMRVRIAGPLAVTDTYSLYRGVVTLSAGQPLRMPTEDAAPGAAARKRATANDQRSLTVELGGDGFPAWPAGTTLTELTGVLGHDGRRQRLFAEGRPQAQSPAPAALAAPAPGQLRIVNSNLLNFFNGDGRGGGFPNERGAATPSEFEAQQARARAAFARILPDLLAVQELENDGFGPDSAAADLQRLLGEATGADFAAVDPGTSRIGVDVITVGLFYRPDRLRPVGLAHVLVGTEFRGVSRQPLAQVFEVRGSGERFLVAANHLKSKGSCPTSGDDQAQDDGQGCWNPSRTAAVQAQLPWLRRLAEQGGTDRILILGDMNAWRREDPIQAFRAAGFVDVVEARQGLPLHSYRYFGQAGTLDYAFASPALADRVADARIWHINADWPRNMTLPEPWLRMSDHDPVIVDLDLSQASTSD